MGSGGKNVATVRLKPADPFELITWLARSQSDPRKAVAELVQNSLDAGASEILVERRRVRGAVTLRVLDDGEGVLPEMERRPALHHLATHIGHSQKMKLDPMERMNRVVAGKYGVGLLGFWSLGKEMELRTRVAGSELMVLRLREESQAAAIERLRCPPDAKDTFTEVVVSPLHAAAQRVVSGRRLSEYLAAELRGQLLARQVELVVHDRLARGTAQKRFRVVPQRFAGERLNLPESVEVDGFAPLLLELYHTPGHERPAVRVSCAGTLVADNVAELEALGLAEDPWVGRELCGVIDFPSLNVPPGTRRGIVPDRAASALAATLEALRPAVLEELEVLERERQALLDRNVARELRRALRGLRYYELPHVERRGASDKGTASNGAPLGRPPAPSPPPRPRPPGVPPGPLVAVRVVPSAVRIAPGLERRVSAIAVDAQGCRLQEVELTWQIIGPDGLTLVGDGARPAIACAPEALPGCEALVRVTAKQNLAMASGSASVVVDDEADDGSDLGVPEPHLVSEPGRNWRSRIQANRWEVNDMHQDYLACRTDQPRRLRYLLSLLAKEIVLRTTGRFETADVLENLVEVLSFAERNLRPARGARR